MTRYRNPTTGQMEILERMVRAAVRAANTGAGDRAARVAVRDTVYAKGMSLADLSRQAGVSKGVLNAMLSYRGGRSCSRARRAVEPVLGLPPGGLGMVLAVVEDMA